MTLPGTAHMTGLASRRSQQAVMPWTVPLTACAQIASWVLSPPMLLAAQLVLALTLDPLAWQGGFAFPLCLATISIASGLVAILRLAGVVSSLELKVRSERVLPSLFACGCGAGAALVLVRSGQAPLLGPLALGVTLQFMLLTVVTLRWKISYHAGMAGALVVAVASLGAAPFITTVACLAVLVCWARVYLRRHTWPQVVAGFSSAAALPLVMGLL